MPAPLNRDVVRQHLDAFDLRTLFIDALGWDHGGTDLTVAVDGQTFELEAIAQKRGFVAYQCVTRGKALPNYATRKKIEREVAKSAHEHLIVFAPRDRGTLCWLWAKRDPGRPVRYRQLTYAKGQSSEALTQRLDSIRFTLDEEEQISIADATSRAAKAFDVEKVTKRFYERFRREHQAFLGFIKGIREVANREWYASLMLNRMMFIYFIQKRGFLDGDREYLRNRLATVARKNGSGKFHTFYRLFLRRLFHEGLGQPEADRDKDLVALLGRIPYLNGGLFDVHELERENQNIDIPDKAFKQIFDFFDAYQWHLDDRPLPVRNDNEINPDVLGYIFEKYVNQKQMGAYYTKEDITGYISRNTIIPRLLDQAKKDCAIAFRPGKGVWQLLAENPDRYFYPSVRHGITFDLEGDRELAEPRALPKKIAAGIKDVAKRAEWNKPAPSEYGLPTETWREHIARRERYEEVRAKLAAGEVSSTNDLVTYNLDIERFAQDAISLSEGPELVRAFWKAIGGITILDPTVGSGAFLFAALNVLEPLYNACLDAMRGLLDDQAHAKRKHRPERLSDFRDVIGQIKRHPSERYYVLKRIVINSLYGVDIMEEAVEICKLRLFLKLVAQLETYDQIEPLPDIDFNVRPGNTLVGFTSMEQVRDVIDGDCIARAALPAIEEHAEIADRAFRQFRAMQTERELDAKLFAAAKQTLRQRLDDLRDELDRYLTEDYGLSPSKRTEFRQWRRTHQPFHWFVEFYGIIDGGGFDVIIGNPPYLEANKVPYRASFETAPGTPIHSMCVSRSLELGRTAGVSMIVPLALVSTQRMKALQELLEGGRDCWYSNFAWRPGKLFDTVNRALTIFVSAKASGGGTTSSTGYLRWGSSSRDHVIPTMRFVEVPRDRVPFWVPKFGEEIEVSVLAKVQAVEGTVADLLLPSATKGKPPNNTVYYRTTGGLYWKVLTDFSPKFLRDGVPDRGGREATFVVSKRAFVRPVVAALSSDVFWWWYTVTSNLRDLNPVDWQSFPLPLAAVNDRHLSQLGSKYIRDLKRNSEMLVRVHGAASRSETQAFKVVKSKSIIDEIDVVLAGHYGFTDKELDFIVNYDIKYRVGTQS